MYLLRTVAEPGKGQAVSGGTLAAPLFRSALPLGADRLALVTSVRAVTLCRKKRRQSDPKVSKYLSILYYYTYRIRERFSVAKPKLHSITVESPKMMKTVEIVLNNFCIYTFPLIKGMFQMLKNVFLVISYISLICVDLYVCNGR